LSKIKVSKIIYKLDYQYFNQWGGICDERPFFFDERLKFLHEGGGKYLCKEVIGRKVNNTVGYTHPHIPATRRTEKS